MIDVKLMDINIDIYCLLSLIVKYYIIFVFINYLFIWDIDYRRYKYMKNISLHTLILCTKN